MPFASDQPFEVAERLCEAGELDRAEAAYRQILGRDPNHVASIEGLGRIALLRGNFAEAIRCVGRAVTIRPQAAHLWANLGMIFAQAGETGNAIDAYGRAVALDPRIADAQVRLGELLHAEGRIHEAIEVYRAALEHQPGMVEAMVNLGNALQQTGSGVEAIETYRRAINLRPDFPEAHNNLGIALAQAGRLVEAGSAYRTAINLQPDYAEAMNHLGLCMHRMGDVGSIEVFKRALSIRPDLVDARMNLAQALRDAGRLDEAVECCAQGPPHPQVASGFIYSLLAHPNVDEKRIAQEQRRWNEQFALPVRHKIEAFRSDQSPDRRLRVGYVARNLGNHPLGRFLLPLFENHDRQQFEVYCYCDVVGKDRVGNGLEEHADVWRTTLGMSDEKVAELVREDRIDILVDLMLHAGNNRLMVFARKPAPVQVSYLGYPGTTGLETIDYRLTDPYLEPPTPPAAGGDERASGRERAIRLPHTFWCYSEPPEAPAVGPLPSGDSNVVTFGCLNIFSKVNSAVIEVWARILGEVGDSQLMLHCFRGKQRERAIGEFAGHGIGRERIRFAGPLPMEEYFAQYNAIDIALDPFPYPGGTTTCDALWMGVPVITLAGTTPLSRGGVSILSNVGCTELIAHSVDEYVNKAVALAGDRERLEAMRTFMREQMKRSPLMDGRRFAGDVEDAYRGMGEKWGRQ